MPSHEASDPNSPDPNSPDPSSADAATLDPATVLRSSPAPIATSIPGETVILDATSGRYFGLDGVGARVWELLARPIAFGELVRTVRDEYQVDADRCAKDLTVLIGELRDAGLVETVDAPVDAPVDDGTSHGTSDGSDERPT